MFFNIFLPIFYHYFSLFIQLFIFIHVYIGSRTWARTFFYIFNKSEKATEAAFSERERNTLFISALRFLVRYTLYNREMNF